MDLDDAVKYIKTVNNTVLPHTSDKYLITYSLKSIVVKEKTLYLQ